MSAHDHSALLRKAKDALAKALAPYSNFPVGAALLTKSGAIYSGCNIESSSYGLTICAERVALFKALSEGEAEFDTIAVVANTEEFCTPCGACRQVLADYAPNLRILLINAQGKTKETSITELLPEAFGKKMLQTKSR